MPTATSGAAPAAQGTGALALRLEYEGHDVRVVGTGDRPVWVVADVCEVLGLTDPTAAVKSLDEDEKGPSIVRTPGGPQEMLCVTVDPMVTAFNEGKRALVLELANELRAFDLFERVYQERFLGVPAPTKEKKP